MNNLVINIYVDCVKCNERMITRSVSLGSINAKCFCGNEVDVRLVPKIEKENK